MQLSETCERHPFEVAQDFCRVCHRPFCPDCLVYTYGSDQPPFCLVCALEAAGIRRVHRASRLRRRQRVS